MKNIWLNIIDKALLYLGYSFNTINSFTDKEKEGLIINEYLYILTESREDCMPFSIDEMAEFIIEWRQANRANVDV